MVNALPITASSDQVQAMVGLRSLVERAKAASGRSDGVSRMEAIILLDFVAESVSKMVVDALKLPMGENEPLKVVLGAVAKALGELGAPLEYRRRIETLREVRNLAQHRLVAPDESTVVRAGQDVSDFTAGLIKTVWDIEIADLSLAEAIADARLRELMTTAERAINGNDERTALIALALADEELSTRSRFRGQPRLHGGLWSWTLRSAFSSFSGRDWAPREAERTMEEFGTAVDGIIDEIDALGAGLSSADHRWYRDVVPLAMGMLSQEYVIVMRVPSPTLSDIRRAFQMLLGRILDAEPLPEEPWVPDLRSRAGAHKSVRVSMSWPVNPTVKEET